MNCDHCGGPLVEGRTLAEMVDRDFSRARLKNRSGGLLWRLRGSGLVNRLLCFAEERDKKTIMSHKSLGIQAVELNKIEGSVGRCRNFDLAFMPVCSCLSEKWKRVNRAFREGRQLPPVRLYKLGGRYFVEDGNHRVSVARYRGLPMIEAKVMELLDNGTATTGSMHNLGTKSLKVEDEW